MRRGPLVFGGAGVKALVQRKKSSGKAQGSVNRLVVFLLVAGFCGAALVLALLGARSAPNFTELKPGPFQAAYLVEDADRTRLKLELIYAAGEVDHTGPEGLAHYVEHLAWLNAFGSGQQGSLRHSNAWTSKFATGYFQTGTKSELGAMLARLVATSSDIALPEAEMLREQRVVLREFSQNATERPTLTLWQGIADALFAGTAYTRTPLGRPETILSFTPEAALALHRETHALAQATLIVHGAVSAGDVERSIADLPLPEGAKPALQALPDLPSEPVYDTAAITIEGIPAKQVAMSRLISLPRSMSASEGMITAALSERVLGSAKPGGLAGPLRFERFIARAFDVDVRYHPAHALRLDFVAYPDQGVSLEELEAAVEELLNAQALEGIETERFEDAKRSYLEELQDDDDLLASTVEYLTLVAEQRRPAPVPLDAYIASVSATTRDAVSAQLARLVRDGRTIIRRVDGGPTAEQP